MIYTIADIATGLFESIVTFIFFGAFLEKREGLNNWIYALGAIGLTLLINLSNMFFDFGLLNLLFVMTLTFAASILYKGNIKEKIIISVAVVALSAIIETLILSLIISLGHFTAEEAIENPKLRLLGIVLSKTLYFIVAKLILIKQKKPLHNISTSYWIIFFSLLLSECLAMGTLFLLQYYNTVAYLDIVSVITVIGLMYSFILTLYMYERISVQAEELTEKTIITNQMQAQKKHVDELFIAQNQIKKIRHDLKNHMLALRALFAKNDCKSGIEYIDNLQSFANMNSEMIDTGNIVLDTILTTKQEVARSKDISAILNIQLPEKLNIDATDLCVLFGNILDNAIEACERASGKKSIEISVIYEKSMFMCKVVNTAPDEKNPFLITTKKNKNEHGIGLSSVRSILDKYESTLNIERTSDKFCLSFIIFTQSVNIVK